MALPCPERCDGYRIYHEIYLKGELRNAARGISVDVFAKKNKKHQKFTKTVLFLKKKSIFMSNDFFC